jgi:imidazole glycerol-phosphate synthase subunit HisH
MIVVVDYGAANLLSITRALEAAGASVEVSADPERIRAAQAVVLPGVGAAGAAMNALRASGVDAALRATIASERPLLGVCLGMQLLFERLEEGDCLGLSVLAGSVTRLRSAPKVPHIGWNSLEWDPTLLAPLARTVFAGVPPGWQAYFVHSYACAPDNPSDAVAWTDYGGPICAAACRGATLGVQFHPEKSGRAGVGLLGAWVAWALTSTPRETPSEVAAHD